MTPFDCPAAHALAIHGLKVTRYERSPFAVEVECVPPHRDNPLGCPEVEAMLALQPKRTLTQEIDDYLKKQLKELYKRDMDIISKPKGQRHESRAEFDARVEALRESMPSKAAPAPRPQVPFATDADVDAVVRWMSRPKPAAVPVPAPVQRVAPMGVMCMREYGDHRLGDFTGSTREGL